jgi:PPM family protein phosphatase
MSGTVATCARCASSVQRTDRFCESCGAPLSEVRRVAIPRSRRATEGPEQPCADCGSKTHVGEYCTVCGNRRAEPDRDQVEIAGIVLISDRGLEHVRNEDAAAAGIVVGSDDERPHAIAVAVCDGVSTSGDSRNAAVAASTAGVDAMLAAMAASRMARSAVMAGLADAAKAAAAARTDLSNAPSCTYTAVTVVATSTGTVQITVGNVGDSRVYWLPEPPAPRQRLTVDDSLAQELITAGVAADSEAVHAGAHTLTRWLGADAESKPWSESSVQSITTAGPGSLVMCTDGLWNYLPDADDIARFCTGMHPTAAANALVDYALQAGGHDNVTVAVIPIGGLHEFS